MKIKSKTKKIIVLSVMVLLLVATGVLNFVLNDKLTSATDGVTTNNAADVTQTFFAAAKSDRDATRESEFLYLDAIMQAETSSQSAKDSAEQQKLLLVERMEAENNLETLIKGLGFDEAIVTMSDSGVSVVVGSGELSSEQANQILSVIVSETSYTASDVKIIPYN